ncbi:MAG: DUF4836 family protein [Bacteroidetes bacterium]|nr:DUF4836 family protein [Bacteroidota bacterium]
MKSKLNFLMLVGVLAVLFSSCKHEPKTASYIPEDVDALVAIDIKSIMNKSGLFDNEAYGFIKAINDTLKTRRDLTLEVLKDMAARPSNTGLRLNQNVFVYAKNHQINIELDTNAFKSAPAKDEYNMTTIAAVAEVLNPKTFGNYINKFLKEISLGYSGIDTILTDTFSVDIKRDFYIPVEYFVYTETDTVKKTRDSVFKKTVKELRGTEVYVADMGQNKFWVWNNEIAYYFRKENTDNRGKYPRYVPVTKKGLFKIKLDEAIANSIATDFYYLFSKDRKSIEGKDNYNALMAKHQDVSAMLSFNSYMNLQPSMFKNMSKNLDLTGSYNLMFMNLNDNDITIETENVLNQGLQDLYNQLGLLNSKINPELFNYIPKESIANAGIAVNLPGIANYAMEQFAGMMPFDSAFYAGFKEKNDTNFSVVTNAFAGDVLFSFSGRDEKEIEKKYPKTVWSDFKDTIVSEATGEKTFKGGMITTTETTKYDSFFNHVHLVAGFKDGEWMRKMIESVLKTPKSDSLGYYEVPMFRLPDTRQPVYANMNEKVVVLSTDPEVVKSVKNGGVKENFSANSAATALQQGNAFMSSSLHVGDFSQKARADMKEVMAKRISKVLIDSLNARSKRVTDTLAWETKADSVASNKIVEVEKKKVKEETEQLKNHAGQMADAYLAMLERFEAIEMTGSGLTSKLVLKMTPGESAGNVLADLLKAFDSNFETIDPFFSWPILTK